MQAGLCYNEPMEARTPAHEHRSYDRFEDSDFEQLAALAALDLTAFIGRNPRHATLANRVLLVALCQGSALHHVDGTHGAKDFDIWTFFGDNGVSPPYPARRIGRARYEGRPFAGSTRRVDLLGRTLPLASDADPIVAVQAYLRGGRTETARCLAARPVVVLSPTAKRGSIIWRGPAA